MIDRRRFLELAGAGAMAGVLGLPISCATSRGGKRGSGGGGPSVKHYNTLGRTGLEVSDIGLGAGRVFDPAVIAYALDRGINYFDTAESYGNGRSESAIGEIAATRRDEMVICTKLMMDESTTADDVTTRLEGSLQRLRTDHVDILMIHTGNRAAVENENIYAAFESLVAAGKVRFTGVSHHGLDIVSGLTPVVEAGVLDVLLCSFDPVGNPDLDAFFQRADDKGLGIVAMKALQSARQAEIAEFESGEYPFHQAALRWCLRNPHVDCVIPTATMMDQIDEFLAASGAGTAT